MALISKLFEEFLQFSDLRDSSVRIYRGALDYWLKYVGDMDISEVEYRHCERFKQSLRQGQRKRVRSGSAANYELAGMRSFFGWCMKDRRIQTNPFQHVRKFTVEHINRPIYKPEEIAALLKACDLEMRIAVLLGLNGYRRGEVQNLTFSEIDWEANTITLRSKPENDETWYWYIKNSKSIPVLMSGELTGCILEKQSQEGRCPYICLDEDRYKKCLLKRKVGLLDRNTPWPGFNSRLREAQKRARIPYKRFQDLRDTYATQLAMEMNIREVQVLMRHSNIQTTAKYYIQIEQEKLRHQAAEIMSKSYMGNSCS